ncbi:hypothetical protein [Acinetobacter terrae]|uniref:Uncharacterized protein n=1 Tax=Acinetobacter terrae TaxID=2731247 RepID=A0A8E4F8Z3_9GAMM|nr:hypothetical protein [Acinetobacter terrae]NNH38443.1 hypothetical protein [Acinetobacter terrae]
MMGQKILNLDGVSTKKIDTRKKYYIVKKSDGSFSSNIKLLMGKIDNACVFYAERLIETLFENEFDVYIKLQKEYFEKLSGNKLFIYAGLSGESLLSRDAFKKYVEETVVKSEMKTYIYKYFYSFEILYLTKNIQNLCRQIQDTLYFFYDQFNSENIFEGRKTKEGLTTIYSREGIVINSILESIIIKTSSLLDYLSKLTFEAENLPLKFDEYPKRKSADYSHGDSLLSQTKVDKKLQWSVQERAGTVFEDKQSDVLLIKKLRNHIVHNGFLDMEASIYENKEKGELKERFILMPDYTEGQLDKYKGRTLFYSQDVKINLILPELLESITQLGFRTIQMLVNKEVIKNKKLIGFKPTEINIEIPDLRPYQLRKNPL